MFYVLNIVLASTASANEDKGLEPGPPKDEDPNGSRLLQATDPLEKAAKWLSPLTNLAQDNINVLIATYDVAVRRSTSTHFTRICHETECTYIIGKYVQAVRALKYAHALDAEHPELHVRLVDFRKTRTYTYTTGPSNAACSLKS